MEQTIQKLSEQLEDKNEENLFGTTPSETSSMEESLTESMLNIIEQPSEISTDEEKPSPITTASQIGDIPASATGLSEEEITDGPPADNMQTTDESELVSQQLAAPTLAFIDKQRIDKAKSTIDQESVSQGSEDTLIQEVVDEHPADNLNPEEPEQKLPTKKKININPEIVHRRINYLVNFQKAFESQLDKMKILSPQEVIKEKHPVKEEVNQENMALELNGENYEQTKNLLKEKDSFDLLESFILLESQKKYD